jgi:ectoine hydroxylase-related dioxygenase (phytanoyl-CoA dioxygenase family)
MTAPPELDPRNKDFAWPDHAGAGQVLTEEQLAAYDRDGFLLLENVLDSDLLDPVEAELDRYSDEREAQLRANGDHGFSRADDLVFTSHLAERGDTLRRFVTSEPFPGVLRDLIGPEVVLDWDQTVYKKPETPKDFPWHQDTGYAYAEPQWGSITCWIPLVDATVENGCIWVVPGAHRRGTIKHWKTDLGMVCKEGDEGAVTVEANRGDMIVFASLTPHKSGPNLSDGVRKAYIAQYAVTGTRTWYKDGLPEGTLLADDPEKHFPVVSSGEPVAA